MFKFSKFVCFCSCEIVQIDYLVDWGQVHFVNLEDLNIQIVDRQLSLG